MSESKSNELTIKIPGEWAAQKVLGPVLGELGEDFRKLYTFGRDNIILAAYRKIANPDDGKHANLRVARDVFWNGAFTDEKVCAEYFGGILAASRSNDGKDDSSIQFVDVIKSLSSKQLRLHYLIYNALNKMLSIKKDILLNVAQSTEIQRHAVWLSSFELQAIHCIDVGIDFNILFRQGLIFEYKTDVIQEVLEELPNGKKVRDLPYCMIKPTTFGILLYAAAQNQMKNWKAFSISDFGDFDGIPSLEKVATSLQELKDFSCSIEYNTTP